MRDITNFVHTYFDDVYDKGSDYVVDCPFCEERAGKVDTKQHMQIAQHKEVCHCFRCDYAGSWIQLIIDVTGYDYVRALGLLYVTPKPVVESIPSLFTDKPQNRPRIRSTEFIFPEGYIPLHNATKRSSRIFTYAKNYLYKRGFKEWYWQRYQLGLHETRILIPIEGDFWQSRAIFSLQQPKYMSPQDESKDVLFNSTALELYDEVVICEGAFSAMAVGENAVALVGKNPTREKISRLLNACVKTYIIVVEHKAEQQMLKMADELYGHGKAVELWKYENNNDPADWVQPTVKEFDFAEKLSMLLA